MPRFQKQQQLRSVKGPSPRAYAVFRNRSLRVVDILWLNWTGNPVSYTVDGLRPGKQMFMNTYEGHPWIFRDHASGDRLVFGTGSDVRRRREVFFPVPSDDGRVAPVRVDIHLPVYTLLERSLQVVRALTNNANFEKLELPRDLILQLANPDETIKTDDEDSPPD